MNTNAPKLEYTYKTKIEVFSHNTNDNKINHFMANPEYKMNPLICISNNINISELEYLQKIKNLKILNVYYKKTLIEILNLTDNKFPIDGIFKEEHNIFVFLHGHKIILTGRVIDGIPMIGTFYVK